MKQKHIIILHPINLCEGNILISQTQIRRIVKAIGDWSQSVRTSMKENGTQYRVRREPSEDVIVDQSINPHAWCGKFTHGTDLTFQNHCLRVVGTS